jgi:hypothetical protein
MFYVPAQGNAALMSHVISVIRATGPAEHGLTASVPPANRKNQASRCFSRFAAYNQAMIFLYLHHHIQEDRQ